MKRIAVLGLLLALTLGTLPALGSTFIALTPREMIDQADAVVQGRVVHLESFWSESGRIIVSEATVEIDEVILGKAPAVVKVRTFGGQVGDIRVEAHGFPVFEQDERVLLFLAREPADDSVRVLGYRQGQFRVVTRRDGVTLAVPMIEEDTRFITRNGQLMPAPESVEIDHFKTRLRTIANEIGRQAR